MASVKSYTYSHSAMDHDTCADCDKAEEEEEDHRLNGSMVGIAQDDIQGMANKESLSAEPRPEPASGSAATPPPPYCRLTMPQKRILIAGCSIIGIWSTISMPIFFPIIPVMEDKFDIDANLVDVAVVCYLIFQGLSPAIFGNLADLVGRRPILIYSMTTYIAANIGLALSDAFWLIIFLRCIQAAGIASVVAIASGIVGDVTQRHERGGFMGYVNSIQLVGQAFGALIGAGLDSAYDWRAIFWFLAIACGVVLILVTIFLPETRRSLAGNLSIVPKRRINRAPILLTPFFKKHILANPDLETLEQPHTDSQRFNIFRSFQMVAYPEVLLCLTSTGTTFATWTLMLTSLSSILTDDYNYSTMHVGLCYLPAGLGSLTGALGSGKVMDILYRKRKAHYDAKVGHLPPSERPEFNIFKARAILYYYAATTFALLMIVFAWSFDKHLPSAVPVTMGFFISMAGMYPMTVAQTLLVDLFPRASSTSSAVLNLFRCLISALFVGVLSTMIDSMGIGGCYTLMAGLCLSTNGLMFLLMEKGPAWVKKRELKEKNKDSSSSTKTPDV